MQPSRTILALNSGSSSLKFGLFRVDGGSANPLASGAVDAIGTEDASFRVHGADGRAFSTDTTPIVDAGDACARIARLVANGTLPAPDAIAHRIVHGGVHLRRHAVIDAGVLRQIEDAVAFAPLHGVAALAVIRAASGVFPAIPAIACLDTAFHATLPDVARTLPIPAGLRAHGIERYGFHGLSCASIVRRLAGNVPPRVVIAHLGSGASVTAVRDGGSIDTTMGLTPSGGLVMATRSGDLDPGVLLYLMRARGLDADALENALDHKAGLLGVSGSSGDMRRLREAAPTDPAARLAIAMFVRSVQKAIVAMATSLGGIDLLVFTGGIGEHDAATRAEVCTGLEWCGITLDCPQKGAPPGMPETPRSRCPVLVVVADEEQEMALIAGGLTA